MSNMDQVRSFLEAQEVTEVNLKLYQARLLMGRAFGGGTIGTCDRLVTFVTRSVLD